MEDKDVTLVKLLEEISELQERQRRMEQQHRVEQEQRQQQAEEQTRRCMDLVEKMLQRDVESRQFPGNPNFVVSVPLDAAEAVEDFQGGAGLTAEDWLTSFLETAELARWSEQDCLLMFKRKMHGPAADWYKALPSKGRWSDVEKSFRKAFCRARQSTDLYREMFARVQGDKESLEAYVRAKQRLCVRCGLDVERTKNEILMTLNRHHDDVNTVMQMRDHSSIDVLLQDMLEFKASKEQRRQVLSGSTPSLANPNESSKKDKTDKGSNGGKGRFQYPRRSAAQGKDPQTPPKDWKAEASCYRCGEQGHIKSECPQRQKSAPGDGLPRPKEEGEPKTTAGKNDEPRKQKKALAVVGDLQNGLSKASDAHNPADLCQLIINGKHTAAGLLDPCADMNLIASRVADRLRLKRDPADITRCEGVGGSQPLRGTVTMDIEVQGNSFDGEQASVVDELPGGIEIVLGKPLLDKPNMAFIWKNGSGLLVDVRNFPRLVLPEEMSSVRLRAHCDIKIPPMSAMLVRLEVEPSSTELSANGICAEAPNLDKDGVLWVESHSDELPSLVCQISDGAVELPVSNCTDTELLVRKGRVVQKALHLAKAVEVRPPTYAGREAAQGVAACAVRRVEKGPIKLNEVNFGPNATNEEKASLLALINRYRHCFAMSISELGRTHLVEFDIKEAPCSTPVYQKPYRASQKEREVLREITDDLLKNDLVSESESPYSSPVLLVKKKTGEYRMVIDYRKLNAQTVKDRFPLPLIDDVLDNVVGFRYLITLDMAHGYFQIPMTQEARARAAFSTPDGHFEPTVLMFGLCNGPAVYQRMMSKAFGHLGPQVATFFLDDVIIGGRTFDELLTKFEKFLISVEKAGLTIKLSKSHFACEDVQFLGFRVTSDGKLYPGEAKTLAIEKFPVPKDKHEIRRFIGLCSFFRRFVRDFAKIARPLTSLLKGDADFFWTAEHQDAFDILKACLTSEPVLAIFDPKRKTEVHTDASGDGIAGMLLQVDETGKQHLVYCVSRSLSSSELNYHSTKLEMLAVVWSLDRFRCYLTGISFTLVTDCTAVAQLKTSRGNKSQFARWQELIADFDFEFQHRPGTSMAHVDACSRAPAGEPTGDEDVITLEPPKVEELTKVMFSLSKEDEIAALQSSDEAVKQIISLITKKNLTASEASIVQGYEMKDGVLFRRIPETGKSVMVVPHHMRKYTVVKAHDFGGHFGVEKSLELAQRYYWFRGMRKYFKQYISCCFECISRKALPGKQQGLLNPIPPGRKPFDLVHVDFLGPFVKSGRGKHYICVLVDTLTKFVFVRAYSSPSAKHAVQLFEELRLIYGKPSRIVSDRGTAFTSKTFEQYCRDHGIQHTLTSTQRPQANGLVERMNRVITTMLGCSTTREDQTDWCRMLPEVQAKINNAPSTSTGKSPFELLHGYQSDLDCNFTERWILEHQDDLWTDASELRADARESILEAQKEYAATYNKRRCEPYILHRGDVVFAKRLPVPTGTSTKLQVKYRGPFVISEVLPSDTYRIASLEQRGAYSTTAHISQLKPFKLMKEEGAQPADEDSSDDSEDNDNNARAVESHDTPEQQAPAKKPPRPQDAVLRRSRRTRKGPHVYGDFVPK